MANPSCHGHQFMTILNIGHLKKLSKKHQNSVGVATVLGKTRIKDEKGSLYLYALDIDSDEVYKILFRLQNPNGGQEYSFVLAMQERSVVVKTMKPNGFHIYWLSHKEH